MNYQLQSSKIDLKPKRHHCYAVFLFILGTVFPPLAVAARFGFGRDFWINLVLTICGYFPGHGHNFYIQNIRNNKTHSRTPKWAQRYGLVDTSEIKRKERKSQWASKFNDRLPSSTLEGRPYEEGQEPGSRENSIEQNGAPKDNNADNNQLWNREHERYYTQSDGRWTYDEGGLGSEQSKGNRKEKKRKDDRWQRTEASYQESLQEPPRKSKKKAKKAKKGNRVDDTSKKQSKNGSRSYTTSIRTSSEGGFPEDPEGGLYGDRPEISNGAPANGHGDGPHGDDVLNQEC